MLFPLVSNTMNVKKSLWGSEMEIIAFQLTYQMTYELLIDLIPPFKFEIGWIVAPAILLEILKDKRNASHLLCGSSTLGDSEKGSLICAILYEQLGPITHCQYSFIAWLWRNVPPPLFYICFPMRTCRFHCTVLLFYVIMYAGYIITRYNQPEKFGKPLLVQAQEFHKVPL